MVEYNHGDAVPLHVYPSIGSLLGYFVHGSSRSVLANDWRVVDLLFDKQGISIPFPQQDVHIYKH